jgi:hypothetical protein
VQSLAPTVVETHASTLLGAVFVAVDCGRRVFGAGAMRFEQYHCGKKRYANRLGVITSHGTDVANFPSVRRWCMMVRAGVQRGFAGVLA